MKNLHRFSLQVYISSHRIRLETIKDYYLHLNYPTFRKWGNERRYPHWSWSIAVGFDLLSSGLEPQPHRCPPASGGVENCKHKRLQKAGCLHLGGSTRCGLRTQPQATRCSSDSASAWGPGGPPGLSVPRAQTKEGPQGSFPSRGHVSAQSACEQGQGQEATLPPAPSSQEDGAGLWPERRPARRTADTPGSHFTPALGLA